MIRFSGVLEGCTEYDGELRGERGDFLSSFKVRVYRKLISLPQLDYFIQSYISTVAILALQLSISPAAVEADNKANKKTKVLSEKK